MIYASTALVGVAESPGHPGKPAARLDHVNARKVGGRGRLGLCTSRWSAWLTGQVQDLRSQWDLRLGTFHRGIVGRYVEGMCSHPPLHHRMIFVGIDAHASSPPNVAGKKSRIQLSFAYSRFQQDMDEWKAPVRRYTAPSTHHDISTDIMVPRKARWSWKYDKSSLPSRDRPCQMKCARLP